MAVQLWKNGKDGRPEMVLIEPEVFNMSFLDAGYRFTEQPEPEKEENEQEKEENEDDKDAEEKPDGTEGRKTDAGEEPRIKEEVLKRTYKLRG